MIYSFNYKTGLPSDVVSEDRIQLAKQKNIARIMEIVLEKGIFYEGEYVVTVEHVMTFKKKFDYHAITTTIMFDMGDDGEEVDSTDVPDKDIDMEE